MEYKWVRTIKLCITILIKTALTQNPVTYMYSHQVLRFVSVFKSNITNIKCQKSIITPYIFTVHVQETVTRYRYFKRIISSSYFSPTWYQLAWGQYILCSTAFQYVEEIGYTICTASQYVQCTCKYIENYTVYIHVYRYMYILAECNVGVRPTWK